MEDFRQSTPQPGRAGDVPALRSRLVGAAGFRAELDHRYHLRVVRTGVV